MSKYYTFTQDYLNFPESVFNFKKALKRIGELDPKHIEKTSLFGRKPDKDKKLKEGQLIGRGILNVRFVLNRHLGKSGKYSNRMIRLSSEAIINETDSSFWIKSKLPKADYKKIVYNTYNILKDCDESYCLKLLNIENKDKYPYQDYHNDMKMKSIAPIQSNLIIRTIKGKTEAITTFAKEFRKEIQGGD